MKDLPVGISTFKDIIEGNFLYVDKTKYIYEMVRPKKGVYFLSRPRRFGKSLLISTLNEIFTGNKELFKGLYIYNTNYDWERYPVIRIDFSKKKVDAKDGLEGYIIRRVEDIAKKYEVKLGDISYEERFDLLINRLYEKYNKPVVVLIDEYDKPLLDNIDNIELAKEIREILKGFYTIIKSEDAHIRFVLLTGVSKFSKTGVFSGLNNLNDITMNNRYSSLLGITQKEVYDYFSPYIDGLAKKLKMSKEKVIEEIKKWYNGYCFSEECQKVYNPFSLLLLFYNEKFSNYWFESGTPTFLIKLIKKTPDFDLSDYIEKYFPEYTFSQYEIEDLKPFPILFQAGYLTISDVKINRDTMEREYRIDFPNFEVKSAFLDILLMSLSPAVKGTGGKQYIKRMKEALIEEEPDFQTFFEELSIFFSNIPYDIQIKREVYYQTIFYTVFLLLGLSIDTEVKTNRGRIDVVIKDENGSKLFIFEFKLDGKKKETSEGAIKQIKEKGYVERYKGRYKKMYLIGVVFDMDERNISNWKVAE